jgi:hypothetical protein
VKTGGEAKSMYQRWGRGSLSIDEALVSYNTLLAFVKASVEFLMSDSQSNTGMGRHIRLLNAVVGPSTLLHPRLGRSGEYRSMSERCQSLQYQSNDETHEIRFFGCYGLFEPEFRQRIVVD